MSVDSPSGATAAATGTRLRTCYCNGSVDRSGKTYLRCVRGPVDPDLGLMSVRELLQLYSNVLTATGMAAQAMESADLATMATILTACPHATQTPGTGPLLLAILLLATGQPEQAATTAEMAVEACTDIQKRANRIRLNKLLTAGDPTLPPEFKTVLKKMIELFDPI